MTRNLKTIRTQTGITLAEISTACSVSIPTVYKWEHGKCPVARKHWDKLAALLETSVGELERILVQTMLDYCLKTGNKSPLTNANASMLYRREVLSAAIAAFDRAFPAPASPPRDLEYREEILKLREEIVRLREENIVLRERAAAPYRVSSSQSPLTDPIITPKIEVKP